jgi:hypothetical protein
MPSNAATQQYCPKRMNYLRKAGRYCTAAAINAQ